jgi:hypothetical protein
LSSIIQMQAELVVAENHSLFSQKPKVRKS